MKIYNKLIKWGIVFGIIVFSSLIIPELILYISPNLKLAKSIYALYCLVLIMTGFKFAYEADKASKY